MQLDQLPGTYSNKQSKIVGPLFQLELYKYWRARVRNPFPQCTHPKQEFWHRVIGTTRVLTRTGSNPVFFMLTLTGSDPVFISLGLIYTLGQALSPLKTFFLFKNLSRAASNIWLVTLIKPYFILILIMMDQISPYLHGVGIKSNNTKPRIVQNATKKRIILELLTEDGWFQELFILFLVLKYLGKYRFNHMQPMTPLMDKLDAYKRLTKS